MMRKLLFVSSYKDLGGGETSLLALTQQLDPQRWQPHLLVAGAGQLSAAWEARGWPVHFTPWRNASVWFIPPLWARLPAARRMERVLRSTGFAAVHGDYHSLPCLLPAARRVGIPTIWTCSGWWFRPRPWQRSFFRQVAATFASSGAIRDGFLGQPPFMPPASVQLLYPGVDDKRFRPRSDVAQLRAELDGLELAPETPLVVMLARFQAVKGHDVFLSMARIVAGELPQTRFLVAGDNPHTRRDQRFRERILESARKDPLLRERLRHVGFRADTERILAAADVVVCASSFESFGMVNLEAMASARPVVSTNRGGPAETVVDGVTGFLVPPGDPAALAQRVLQLLRDPAMRARMGAAGRAHVLRHFTAAASARTFERSLERLLATRRA
ncbi:MAG: glycosyltransferase family 4 protein [Anaerolineaceae bacterium]|nr:glycosyltransferase family 4 protein [Anaerolineaceae bacterium]